VTVEERLKGDQIPHELQYAPDSNGGQGSKPPRVSGSLTSYRMIYVIEMS
jgi:hypothetical protein